ncbi:hypothetical protein SCUCBS95973_005693 [Sporothrix curviconia]|uniref:Cytochrome P450 monooxygenase n=1 Tax=Sporothrix curviconia TaxID=1260050 RepID=A0ABP0BYY9_9PEZI
MDFPVAEILARLKLAGMALGAVTAAYLVIVSVYRLWFHPLARFPGPIANRISWIPGGPVIRLSPNEFAFNSAQAWTDVYGHKIGRLDLEKDPIHVGAVDPVPGVSTISMADRDNHARQRKALSYGFSKKALWEQESLIQHFIDLLMVRLHGFAQTPDEGFDIVKWYNFMTFDVIGDLSFGESFGCLERGDFHFWIHLIFDAVKAGAIEQACQGGLSKQRADHAYSREKVMRRLQDTKSDRRDFIYYILKQGEHYDLSQNEVIVNAALFIVARSSTTASSLAADTNFLLKNPHTYAKAKAEVRAAFAAEDEITVGAMDKLPYMNACLEEGLRMFPPAPIGFLRTVQAQGDVIDGHAIPGGTAVSVSTWCASHAADNFRDPDAFIPERWMDPAYSADKKLASQSFSLGPRGCIGKDLSYMEQRVTLARALFNFELSLADDAREWDTDNNMQNMKAYSTWQKPPLPVKLVDRRVPTSKYWRQKNAAAKAEGLVAVAEAVAVIVVPSEETASHKMVQTMIHKAPLI